MKNDQWFTQARGYFNNSYKYSSIESITEWIVYKWLITRASLLNTVPDGICVSQFSHLCKKKKKKKPNLNKVCVLFVLPWIHSLVLKLALLQCQPGVFPLTRCHSDQHTQLVPSGLRAQIWQTTWKQKRQCKHGYFHSFDMLNTQNPTPAKGPISVARCLAIHMVRT